MDINKNMKKLISVFVIWQVSSLCVAQPKESFSFTTRKLIEGAVNQVKIIPNNSQKIVSISVSNGSIKKGASSSLVMKNGKTIQTQDSLYFWQICGSPNKIEELVINSILDNILNSDTILFHVETGPILKVKPYKKNGGKDFFTNTTTKGITPSNIDGISLQGRSLEFAFGVGIEDFSIELIRKKKIVKRLFNYGGKISEENKLILKSFKGDYIKIQQVNAHLECGLKVEVKDPDPIYY